MLYNLKFHLENILHCHEDMANNLSKSFRKFDNKTNYSVHQIWCATTIATEILLPEETRIIGFYTLLYHDVLEDTSGNLPKFDLFDNEINKSIHDMTFDSFSEEIKNLWSKSKEIRLFKLYDKTNNFLNLDGWPPAKIKQHYDHLNNLIQDVQSNFGNLNITYIANSIKNKYVD